MTWEEAVEMIREKAEYADLVKNAYFESDLVLNVERYYKSQEYQEIQNWLGGLGINSGKILDIGSGNGISALSFALDGFQVDAVEPDPSETVGAAAIRKLKNHYQIPNITIHESYAEDVRFTANSYDLVFARQALHHANDLNRFVQESYRVLKPNGYMITVRDHVVFDAKDKELFLQKHPLHRFYGGENAFHPEEYEEAFRKAGFAIEKKYKYFDTPVNYFPATKESITPEGKIDKLRTNFRNKYPKLGRMVFAFQLYITYLKLRGYSFTNDEMKIPGRMYSYILRKGKL